MKRKSEDTDETEHRRKMPTNAFQQYLQTRNRDNTAAVCAENPDRHVNAVYEISFHLNLSQNIREKGTELLYAARAVDSCTPDIPTLFIQASVCIWLAQKLQGNSGYRISTLLNVYPKLTKTISYQVLTKSKTTSTLRTGLLEPSISNLSRNSEYAQLQLCRRFNWIADSEPHSCIV